MPNIVIGLPPNMSEIVKVFPGAHKTGVIFTYGDTIYNPDSTIIGPELMAHETIHSNRQVVPSVWWDSYLKDIEFRLQEELLAHVAEYKAFCVRKTDRNLRMRYLVDTAQRLSGPLYNNMISFGKAMEKIA